MHYKLNVYIFKVTSIVYFHPCFKQTIQCMEARFWYTCMGSLHNRIPAKTFFCMNLRTFNVAQDQLPYFNMYVPMVCSCP